MREDEYIRHDATALAELVRTGETTAGELLDVAMARLSRWNPRINAVVLELEERARQQIRRGIQDAPFAGVPFLVKDLDGFLAGAEFTASSHSLAGYVPERDSELFTRYQQAGLMIFGKTNTPEFGLVGTTESRLSIRRAAVPAALRPRWQRASCRWRTGAMAVDRSAYPPRPADCSG